MSRRRRRASGKRPPKPANTPASHAAAPVSAARSRAPSSVPTATPQPARSHSAPKAKASKRSVTPRRDPVAWVRGLPWSHVGRALPRASRDWQMLGCVAFCAVGVTSSLLHVLTELQFHLSAAWPAWVCGLAVSAAGAATGLWLPPRMLRRRVTVAGAPTGVAVEFEFAASLVGVLILTLGVAAALAAGYAQMMESVRGFITARFLWPVGLSRMVLTLPAWLGLFVLAGLSAMLVVALHGWRQAATATAVGVRTLWLVALAVAGVTAAIVGRSGTGPLSYVLTLLPLFAAGFLAVVQRGPRAENAPATPQYALTVQPLWLPSATAALVGTILARAAWQIDAPAIGGAWAAAACCGCALLALLIGRFIVRRDVDADALALVVLPILGALEICPAEWLGGSPAAAAITRVALAVGLGAGVVQRYAWRLAAQCGRPQPVLEVLGTRCLAAVAGGLIALPMLAAVLPGAFVVTLTALGATAIAGVGLAFRTPAPGSLRVAGWGALGAALLLMLVQASFGPAMRAPVEPAPRTLADALGPWAARVENLAQVTLQRGGGAELPSAWELDWYGPQWDAVVVRSAPARDLSPGQARRVLQRCDRALRHGGRLLLEAPSATLARAARTYHAVGGLAPAPERERLTAISDGSRSQLIALGHDVLEWIERYARDDEPTYTAQPLYTQHTPPRVSPPQR